MKAKDVVLVFLLMTIAVFVVSACSNTPSGELGYNGTWHYDSEYHWRDKDENGDDWKSKHNFINDVCNLCGYSRKKDEPTDSGDTGDTGDTGETEEPIPDPTDPGNGVGGDYEEGDTILDGFSYTVLFGEDGISYSIGVGEHTNDRHIDIPATYNDAPVIAIDDNGFFNDKNLESITLPESITTIGFEAFAGCTSLKTFDMPNSVTTMYHRAFFDCKGLTEIKFSESLQVINSKTFTNCTSLKKVKLPESLTKIENDGFTDCTGLEEVYFPKSLQLLNYTVFINCPKISKVVAYDLETWMSITYRHVTSNPCFYGAKLYFNSTGTEELVTELNIPEDTKKIKMATFCGCSSIQTVVIPESVTEIGLQAFSGCTGIKTFTANGVTELDNGVFSGMSSLEKVWITGAVTINNDVFFDDKNLKEVHFGKNLNLLGQRAFGYCSSLNDIYYEGTADEWNAIFKVSPSNAGNWWDVGTPEYTIHCEGGGTATKESYDEKWGDWHGTPFYKA